MPHSMFLDVMDGVLETLNLFEPDNKKAEIIARAWASLRWGLLNITQRLGKC